MTLLDFEWKFKKPKPQPAASYSAHENRPGIRQSPYYTQYYKQKCHNMSRTQLPSNDIAVDSVCKINYADFKLMWQFYETDKCNSESTTETNDLPPKFNDVLGIIESEWKEEMLEISNVAMLEKLLTKLRQQGFFDDFINLMYFLTYGEMDINSIPVRTLLETAHFYSLNDT